MGRGVYSSTGRMRRMVDKCAVSYDAAVSSGFAPDTYEPAPVEQIFTNLSMNKSMNPYGVTIRESRDSEEHPNSLAVIIALDVTGSMGMVPEALVREGLPRIMETIISRGVQDPQVLFLAIGDHECDRAPLQVGQFESGDELLDKWLTDVYLEGLGGGNYGESYMLAWYFAAMHTSIDCLEKRGKKGFLFTIGDEPVLKNLPAYNLEKIMGGEQHMTYTSEKLLSMAREKYDTYHINIMETGSGSRPEVYNEWKQRMGDHYLPAQKHSDVASIIAQAIVNNYDAKPVEQSQVADKPSEEVAKEPSEEVVKPKKPSMML